MTSLQQNGNKNDTISSRRITRATTEGTAGIVNGTHDIKSHTNCAEIVCKANDQFRRRTFVTIFISLLLDLIGFTMILPLFPAILDYYGHHDNNDFIYKGILNVTRDFRQLTGTPDTSRWNAVLFGGILGSMFCFLQFLSIPIIGALSDVFGRKPLLLLTMLGSCASYLLWYFSTSFTVFVLSRIVAGLSKANVAISAAVVSDVSTAESRGRGMALVGVAFSLGFLVGPPLGVYFSQVYRDVGGPITSPALLCLTLALLDVVYLAVSFKETLPPKKRSNSLGNGIQNSLRIINPVSLFTFEAMDNIKLRERSILQKLGWSYFLYLFIYSGLEFNLTFLTNVRFNYTNVDQGKMFCIMGVIMIIVQGGFARRIPPGRELNVAFGGIMTAIPAFILLGVATTSLTYHIGLVLFSVASGLVVPTLTVRVSLMADDRNQGRLMGILRSLGSLARALGPLTASIAFWSLGPAVTYTTGALALVAPLLILRTVYAS